MPFPRGAHSTRLPGGVDSQETPLRCFFGAMPIHVAEADYASRLET
jgi:hypothetical protein